MGKIVVEKSLGTEGSMEQPALLSITRTETVYRFRLDLPDGFKDQSFAGQEYIADLNAEQSERLRRALQVAA